MISDKKKRTFGESVMSDHDLNTGVRKTYKRNEQLNCSLEDKNECFRQRQGEENSWHCRGHERGKCLETERN